MSYGVKTFIGCVFAAVAISFLVTTGVLVWEYWSTDWLAIASFYSHLFLFFPTFGIVTLLAFYTPACVFTDMYLRHIPYGVQRFAFGLVLVIVASIGGANMMAGAGERSIFEVEPDRLRLDRGEPDKCEQSGACERVPILRRLHFSRRRSRMPRARPLPPSG